MAWIGPGFRLSLASRISYKQGGVIGAIGGLDPDPSISKDDPLSGSKAVFGFLDPNPLRICMKKTKLLPTSFRYFISVFFPDHYLGKPQIFFCSGQSNKRGGGGGKVFFLNL